LKHTDINDVSFELIPIDLVTVDIDDSPILNIFRGAGTKGNRRGVNDTAEIAPLHRGPVLGYVTV
jgi:hypothetical protein